MSKSRETQSMRLYDSTAKSKEQDQGKNPQTINFDRGSIRTPDKGRPLRSREWRGRQLFVHRRGITGKPRWREIVLSVQSIAGAPAG
jgi:hypothetical protein